MTTQPTTQKAGSVIEKESSGGLNLMLHPLVIINLSDHWTRARVQNRVDNPRVIGALLGTQSGRNVEILNSFELVYGVVNGLVVIEQKYWNTKQEQFKKVFPTYDFLGWYSTGEGVQPQDIEVHKQVSEANESPLYLVLDPLACFKPNTKELPVHIFESELRMVEDKPMMFFAKVPHRIETGEAERIAVDHVARITPSGGSSGSSLSAHMIGIFNAITMLNVRVKILLAFLASVKAGKTPQESGLMRRIASLCTQLVAIDTTATKGDFINEYNDALIVTYLSAITKGSNSTNELIDKFNLSYDKHSRRRGFF